jgi:DNA helicase-2/ATP-dependent DNA helicase PcrA
MKTVSGMDGITVNTIHQAKGLEYEVVFLNNVSEGSVPYQYWDPVSRQRHPLTDNNLIDGKAKLYVGISRARKILIILHNWMPSLFIPIIKRSEDN